MLELKVRDGNSDVVLRFEHSLRSLSKWESIHKKPFQATPTKTAMEMIDYYQCMLLDEVDKNLVLRLSPEQLEDLTNYINTPQTASSVPKDPHSRGPREVVTSELIYYWMVGLKINWEAQDWHLSRLMMLIEITNYKQQPEKKRSVTERLADWNAVKQRNKERFGIEG